MFHIVTEPATDRSAFADRPARRRNSALRMQSLDEAYEARLLAQVARWDDQAAFTELYERHAPAVTRAALKICGNPDTAADIAQQTFTALWIRAERLAGKALRLRPWLCTVARNAAIDHLRGAHAATITLDAMVEATSSGAGPEAYATARESVHELHAALATLSAEQCEAVELVYFGALTYEAAARATGHAVGTLKTRVRLALGHLRECMPQAPR